MGVRALLYLRHDDGLGLVGGIGVIFVSGELVVHGLRPVWYISSTGHGPGKRQRDKRSKKKDTQKVTFCGGWGLPLPPP